MDAQTFLGLRRAEAPGRWELPVTPSISSGMGSLFGGCGLAALIEALEQESGRPVAWAAAQYLSHAGPPAVVAIETVLAVEGRTITQARGIGWVDGRELITVNAGLGRRPYEHTGQWAARPDVPPPGDCPPRPLLPRQRETIMSVMEARLADARGPEELPGPPGSGRCALWVRVPGLEVSSAYLAVLGDFVPFGIGQALGRRAGGGSIDNTIRVVRPVPTEWVLADIRIHAVYGGLAHGLVHLWADDGTLMATASQSSMVREWRDHPMLRDMEAALADEANGEGA